MRRRWALFVFMMLSVATSAGLTAVPVSAATGGDGAPAAVATTTTQPSATATTTTAPTSTTTTTTTTLATTTTTVPDDPPILCNGRAECEQAKAVCAANGLDQCQQITTCYIDALLAKPDPLVKEIFPFKCFPEVVGNAQAFFCQLFGCPKLDPCILWKCVNGRLVEPVVTPPPTIPTTTSAPTTTAPPAAVPPANTGGGSGPPATVAGVTVTATPTTTPQAPTSSDGVLAFTGSSTGWMALGGVAVLMIGFYVMLLGAFTHDPFGGRTRGGFTVTHVSKLTGDLVTMRISTRNTERD